MFSPQKTNLYPPPEHRMEQQPPNGEIYKKIDEFLNIYNNEYVSSSKYFSHIFFFKKSKERNNSKISKFKNLLLKMDGAIMKSEEIMQKELSSNDQEDRETKFEETPPHNQNPKKEETPPNENKNFEDDERSEEEEETKREEENEGDEDTIKDLPEEVLNKKYNEYILKRQFFMNEVKDSKYNGMIFSSEEERANKIFKKLVKNLKGQLHDSFYKEFTMKHKEMIEKTNIYKILKKMPKGANLHLHVDTAFDPDWVKLINSLSLNVY